MVMVTCVGWRLPPHEMLHWRGLCMPQHGCRLLVLVNMVPFIALGDPHYLTHQIFDGKSQTSSSLGKWRPGLFMDGSPVAILAGL